MDDLHHAIQDARYMGERARGTKLQPERRLNWPDSAEVEETKKERLEADPDAFAFEV